jgi:hypothetical protein
MISTAARKAFKGQQYIKFLATIDPAGVPNVAAILSARMIDDETIVFVRFMAWKTAHNLEATRFASFGCIGPRGRAYLAAGEFAGWETTGPLIEQFSTEAMYRYNAYMGATHIGVVKISGVEELPAGLIGPAFRARRRAARVDGPGPMAAPVQEKWRRVLAAKCLAMTEAGRPLALPTLGLSPAGPDRLRFEIPVAIGSGHPFTRLAAGAPLAAAVFCTDPSAFQVKGKFSGSDGRVGTMTVTEVYAASPPIPGKRIYPPEA